MIIITIIFDAIEMVKEHQEAQRQKVETITQRINGKPKFIIINASDNPANQRYIDNKIKAGEAIGLEVEVRKFDEDCSNEDILSVIEFCNILKIPVILQLPIYEHLDEKKLVKAIRAYVDADCFNEIWLGLIMTNTDVSLMPATPKGVMNLLEYHKVPIEGKTALVIGRSTHVGKPIANILINKGATVIVANSKTEDLNSLVSKADIIISCVGKTNLINKDYIKTGATLVGVGFSYEGRKQVLDFDVEAIVEDSKASLVSNRINCTGKATVDSLIDNVLELYMMNYPE